MSDLLDKKLRTINSWLEDVQGEAGKRMEEMIEEAVVVAENEARKAHEKEKDTTTKGLRWEIDSLKKDLWSAKRAMKGAEENTVAAEERLQTNDDDWRRRGKEKQEAYEREAKRLRGVNMVALERARLAENALALERARSAENVVGEKRSRDPSGSREGDVGREGGKGGRSSREIPLNVLRGPYVTRHEIEAREMEARERRDGGDTAHKGPDGGTGTPSTTGPFSREVSQARGVDKEGEGNGGHSRAIESPLLSGSSSEARRGAPEREEEGAGSVATATSMVVDLMDTSLDEGGGRGTGQESGVSEGEISDPDEAANQGQTRVAPPTEEEKAALAKKKKQASDKAYRDRRKAEKAALEEAAREEATREEVARKEPALEESALDESALNEGEGGTIEASAGTSSAEKPAEGTLRVEKRKAPPTGTGKTRAPTLDEADKGGA
jgi:hypothetical protein